LLTARHLNWQKYLFFTAVGESAWQKVREIGHVVISFTGANSTDRPGEICASEIAGEDLVAALKEGQIITIDG
jgi:PTS system glucitol/sorbitol-specific IIA component